VDTQSLWFLNRFERLGAQAAEVTGTASRIIEPLEIVGHVVTCKCREYMI
jgi:hypothetical protein